MFFTKKQDNNKVNVPYVPTEQDLLNMYADMVPIDISGEKEFQEREEAIFAKLNEVEGFNEYLTETLARDMRRHFQSATPQEQWMARGAYARIVYFKSKLGMKKPKPVESKTKIGTRYA